MFSPSLFPRGVSTPTPTPTPTPTGNVVPFLEYSANFLINVAGNIDVIQNLTTTRSIIVSGFSIRRGDDNAYPIDYLWKDSSGLNLWGPFHILSAGNGAGTGSSPIPFGWFATGVGKDLVLNASDLGAAGGGVTYWYQ